jgi:hypothetical protein
LQQCNKTKQNKPAKIIKVKFYFAMFYQIPVDTFAMFYQIPVDTFAMFYQIPVDTFAMFYQIPVDTFAMFYQIPVDTFPYQLSPDNNERFTLRLTVASSAGI